MLKIHPETSKKFIDSKISYLNKFLLLSYPISNASISNITIDELLDLMQKERLEAYKLGTRRSIPVILEVKDGNTFVKLRDVGHTLKFYSLTSCIEYLRGLGLTIKRETLTRYIKMGKVFHNFLCKYSDIALPDNFEQVGLIMEEYLRLNINKVESSKVNRKNKSVSVKGADFERDFESITDTLNYFETLNIKLDRKTLYLRLKDGKYI